MKKKSTVLILLLALSLISMIPVLSMKTVAAVDVVGPTTTKPGIIDWSYPDGYANYQTLAWNPEYLNLYTQTPLPTRTTVIVQGTDTYGQNIEATVQIGPITVSQEGTFIFNDTHSGKPVAFATITGMFQQNGTHNDRFLIQTQPEPWEEYLGQWHLSSKWLPGEYLWEYNDGRKYLVATGVSTPCKTQNVPVEPSNPDPLKILINWHESDGNLIPGSGEYGAVSTTPPVGSKYWIWIEGLDQKGNKLAVNTTIPAGVHSVDVSTGSGCHTWSTVCKVEGNGPDSYYLFTEPHDVRPLFTYTLLIDHITIAPNCYDILAYPNAIDGTYPGVTKINVTLRDLDGNLISAAEKDIVVNFATSGGRVQPSSDVYIRAYHFFTERQVNLTADTNARRVNVTTDANVPACTYCPAMNLFAWTEMTFDGINSVLFTGGWPIHTMMWGYHTYIDGIGWQTPFTGPVPPKPYVPYVMGGPAPDGIKLDGPIYEVMIPLYVGCNLISCPVHPMLCTNYYCEAYPLETNCRGIPMDLLFGKTSATTCIEAVWWYDSLGTWHHYIPGVDDQPSAYFTDGVGYWIKAEKPCTLEISGVLMENGPFTPPTYTLTAQSWNLVGVTSITGMTIKDYLESVNSGDPAYMSAAGPVWIYNAKYGAWVRNPSWGLWPTQGFWIYNKVPADLYIAP